jgi:uncharacterized protein YkwD
MHPRMATVTTIRRRCIHLLVLGLLLSVMALAPASPASASVASTNESAFLTKLNQERTRRGLSALVLDNPLAATARDWSATMNSRNALSHDPGLAADASAVEPSWRAVAENVGVGYSVQQLHDAFMGSSGHRANILGSYNRVGIGVVMNGSKIWVTVRFLRGPTITGTTGLGPPPPPPGVRTALVGDFDGDGYGDVLTYGPGSQADELWFGRPDRSHRKVSVAVNGQYRPVAGDFDGNGRTDILWYAPGGTADYRWSWNGSSWTSTPMTVNGTYAPLVGDFEGDGVDDLLWYAPGTGGDYYWYGNRNGSYTSAPTRINGYYRPLVGNLDGVKGDDLFWYAPGSASDWMWYSVGARSRYDNVHTVVNGTYTPFTGDIDGQGSDDIYWYAPGSAGDYLWFTSSVRGRYTSVQRNVGGSYLPVASDFDGNRADDILWFAPSSAEGDPLWWGTPGSKTPTGASLHR